MLRREIWWFVAAVGVEGAAVGVGLVMGAQWGWLVATVGCLVALLGFWRAYKVGHIPSFKRTYKKSSAVWGLWHSGGRTREQRLHVRYGSLRRILILDPYTTEFTSGSLFEGYYDTPKHAKIDICALTREAVAKGISVRWYPKMQSVIYTIFDPERDAAWLVAEEHKPNVPRDDRPRKILKKPNNRAEFESIITKYETIWQTARTPSPEEYSLEAQHAGPDNPTVSK